MNARRPYDVALLEVPVTRGASRADGPQTSRDAGRSMSGAVLRDQQRLVLGAVAHLGTATAWEVHSKACNLVQQSVISKRLGELVALGMVRPTGATRPGSSQRSQIVYEVTEAGSAAA